MLGCPTLLARLWRDGAYLCVKPVQRLHLLAGERQLRFRQIEDWQAPSTYLMRADLRVARPVPEAVQ